MYVRTRPKANNRVRLDSCPRAKVSCLACIRKYYLAIMWYYLACIYSAVPGLCCPCQGSCHTYLAVVLLLSLSVPILPLPPFFHPHPHSRLSGSVLSRFRIHRHTRYFSSSSLVSAAPSFLPVVFQSAESRHPQQHRFSARPLFV